MTDTLQTQFGVSGTALSWIQTYLTDRRQFVTVGQHQLTETKLEVGVPQGSVLGPLKCHHSFIHSFIHHFCKMLVGKRNCYKCK